MSDPTTPSTPGSAPGPQDPASTKASAKPAGGSPEKKDQKPDTSGGKSTTSTGKSDKSGKSGKPSKADDPLRRSRAGGFYLAVIGLAVVLVLLIIFIVQNTEPTTVRFLSFEGDTPVAVALLAAAAAGMFLASIAASLRIIQLRRRVKHDRKS